MIIGLVLGKFYPLHTGHIGLIKYAEQQCDKLFVLICAADEENIDGKIRLNWIKNTFTENPVIQPILLNYTAKELPNTSVSSKVVAKIWASKITETLGQIDIVFSSEEYGNYLATFLQCQHLSYQPQRLSYQISASEIRETPFKH